MAVRPQCASAKILVKTSVGSGCGTFKAGHPDLIFPDGTAPTFADVQGQRLDFLQKSFLA